MLAYLYEAKDERDKSAKMWARVEGKPATATVSARR